MLDSSEASGNEDLGNEADSDDNNQVSIVLIGYFSWAVTRLFFGFRVFHFISFISLFLSDW